jgi:hypothetical protein
MKGASSTAGLVGPPLRIVDHEIRKERLAEHRIRREPQRAAGFVVRVHDGPVRVLGDPHTPGKPRASNARA